MRFYLHKHASWCWTVSGQPLFKYMYRYHVIIMRHFTEADKNRRHFEYDVFLSYYQWSYGEDLARCHGNRVFHQIRSRQRSSKWQWHLHGVARRCAKSEHCWRYVQSSGGRESRGADLFWMLVSQSSLRSKQRVFTCVHVSICINTFLHVSARFLQNISNTFLN